MNKTEKKFAGLAVRIRTALMLLPLVLLPIYWGGAAFVALLIIAAIFMAYEWTALLQSGHKNRDGFCLSFLLIAHLLVAAMTTPQNALALLLVSLCFGAGLACVGGVRMTPVMGGLLYIGWPLLAAFYLYVMAGELASIIIFYVLISVWAVDIFAMFGGKFIGGAKLAPRLSPSKTWAGLLGAVAGAAGVAVASHMVFMASPHFALTQANVNKMLVLAVSIALVAQFGDLFESYLKRKYNRKDSGNLMPGHGGILDRVDGLIAVLVFLHILVLINGTTPIDALFFVGGR